MNDFQHKVTDWCIETFGSEKANDTLERQWRFTEESLELVQSLDMTAEDCHKLVDYVYGRPKGDPHQELGGVMVTLGALCTPVNLKMDEAGWDELRRIYTPEVMDKIRAKQAVKEASGLYTNTRNPLPGDA